MRKLTNFLIAATIGLAMVACKSEEVPPVDNTKGNTYASLEIGYAPMKSPVTKSTRAVTETSFEGTAVERAVNKVTVFGEATATANREFTNPVQKAANIWTVPAWQTTAGSRPFGLAINLATAPAVNLASETATDGAKLTGPITAYVSDNGNPGITMSSTVVKTQMINAGVSEAQANSGTTAADNVVEFDMKRVVAKAAVRAAGTSINVTNGDGGATLGAFSTLTFAPTNLSKESFLFQKLGANNDVYQPSNVDTYMLPATATEVGANASNYARLGDADLSALVAPGATAYHPYKAVEMNSTTDPIADIEGNYFFENIERALFWGNVTYMKVYGTYTPAVTEIQQLNSAGDALENPTTFAAGTTFYKGAIDGKLYVTKEAAQFAVAGQQVYMYKNGRMGYRVLVYQDPADANFQDSGTGANPVTNADVLRNYFYILDITAIQGLGFNYDGNDPNDPNLPKPTNGENPDEPTVPEDGVTPDMPINTKDTYMRVQATILPWTVVSRDVILK